MTQSVGSKCFSAEGETAKIIDFLCKDHRSSNPAAAASNHHVLYLRLAPGPENRGGCVSCRRSSLKRRAGTSRSSFSEQTSARWVFSSSRAAGRLLGTALSRRQRRRRGDRTVDLENNISSLCVSLMISLFPGEMHGCTERLPACQRCLCRKFRSPFRCGSS